MATSGSAIGGNDVFNGKNKISWWLLSQTMTGGTGHGTSTVRWAMNVNWSPGDNCHTIQNANVTGNSVSRYDNNGVVHAFSGSHVHNGDYPAVSSGGGGFATGTYVINHDSNGNANIVLTSFHHGTSGAQSTASLTTALTQIPQTVASPSAATATRVSDTQQTVAWTNNSTGTAPYANVKVFRSTDGGAYALIATLGVVTSYSDTSTSANHKYTYQISAVGSNGVEVGFATTSAIWTTPGVPTSLTAVKLVGGNIRLTWTNNTSFAEYTVRIEESQNGGAYSEIASVSNGIVTWDHVAPNAGVTHQYKIRARTSSGTTLNSAYSTASAVVVLLSTAGAPSGLSPSGTAADATEAIVFTWVHNPTDGTPQSKYQLQYKIDAGAFTTVGPTTSGVSSYALPAATLSNAHTITWHVATAGENGTIGAYSADSVFTTSARPTSNVSTPTGTYSFSALVVDWTYFQAQGSPQSAWHAFLYHKIGVDFSDAVLLEEKAGTGTTAETPFTTALLDGQTYGVIVYVTSAAGLISIASGTELQEFTVTYLPPANVTITPTYEPDTGSMIVMIEGADAVPGVTETISSVDLQRKINDGEWVTWVTGVILAGTPLLAILVDTMPTIRGVNTYRAIVRSAVPSSQISSEVSTVTAEERWGFLSTSTSSFSDRIRVRARLGMRSATGREKATYHFAGRSQAVELSGESTPLTLAIQATLYPPSRGGISSEPQELEAMAETTGIVLWRDFSGRRIFASMGSPTIDYNTDSILYPVAFDLTRIDYDENVA